jgi:glycosyltransferase involved in cell wall biosynthesis
MNTIAKTAVSPKEVLTFVIPCYNSEKTISLVVNEIIQTVESSNQYDYEIIMVSDHSPDNVFTVIQSLCAGNPKLTGIELARNFGQHSALLAGYAHANGKYIISLDDDGQAPLESTLTLVAALDDGADVVFGAYQERKHNVFRKFGSYINQLMMKWLMDKPMELQTNSFFAARKFIIDEMVKYDHPYPYLLGLILRITKNISTVSVNHRERAQGKSGYSLTKLFHLWLNGFTAFSVQPLRFATIMGVACSFVGFLLGLFVVIRKIINPEIQAGYSSLMAVIFFIGGTIMLMLGMIGEYIGRSYICINKAPQYVIREITRKEDK